ncbi:transcriptional regulator [Halopseudomonas aestusnigri]|uniref:transcriptional regulator n=1 Tax=Halopseudomonas aestusnigri TaxID=857252 RepID=UPI0030023E1F
MSAISKAVEKAGSQAELARLLGVSSQAINKMLAAKRVPAERVLKIEEVTGVSRHELRPDLYPEEESAA